MNTLCKQWCVRLVGGSNHLLQVEFIGKLEECVRFVEPRCHGRYAILPHEL